VAQEEAQQRRVVDTYRLPYGDGSPHGDELRATLV
jgi:hypothetical protein